MPSAGYTIWESSSPRVCIVRTEGMRLASGSSRCLHEALPPPSTSAAQHRLRHECQLEWSTHRQQHIGPIPPRCLLQMCGASHRPLARTEESQRVSRIMDQVGVQTGKKFTFSSKGVMTSAFPIDTRLRIAATGLFGFRTIELGVIGINMSTVLKDVILGG